MSPVIDTVKFVASGIEAKLVGGSFWEMKEFISDRNLFPHRKWEGKETGWVLAQPIEEIKSNLPEGWQIIQDEEQELGVEVEAIASMQAQILWYREVISFESYCLLKQTERYSYRSKSREKARLARDGKCLHHALSHAQLPIDELAAPAIASMRRSLEILDEVSNSTASEWIRYFAVENLQTVDWSKATVEHIVPCNCVNLAKVPTKTFPWGTERLWQKYVADLSLEWDIPAGLLPGVREEERMGPDGELSGVIIFQLADPGDDR